MRDLTALKELIQVHFDEIISSYAKAGPLHEPMAYILELGGKRIRPLLVLMSYQAIQGGGAEKALNAAASVELFHNFTLMHDDIMDNAPVRRGKPTVHEKWDEDMAILSGDAMFAHAVEYLVRDFPERAAALVKEFSRVSIGVCEGQVEDMMMAGNQGLKVETYIEMIRKKTAMLLGGSLSLGAIAAGASPEQVEALYTFGELAGIGFQLQDDYLDVYAEQAKFGKQVGGDILENKMTFLLITALDKANPAQKAELNRLLFEEEDPQRKIEGVKAQYAAMGIPEATQAEIAGYFDRARAQAKSLSGVKGFSYIEDFLADLFKRER